MAYYDEFVRSRSFTGVDDETWDLFSKIIGYNIGRGKRSMFIAMLIKKTVENAENEFEKRADIEQRAEHSVNDTKKFFSVKDFRYIKKREPELDTV